jgi:hypothetical protein
VRGDRLGADRTSQSTVLGLLLNPELACGPDEDENAGGGVNWIPGLLGTMTGGVTTFPVKPNWPLENCDPPGLFERLMSPSTTCTYKPGGSAGSAARGSSATALLALRSLGSALQYSFLDPSRFVLPSSFFASFFSSLVVGLAEVGAVGVDAVGVETVGVETVGVAEAEAVGFAATSEGGTKDVPESGSGVVGPQATAVTLPSVWVAH